MDSMMPGVTVHVATWNDGLFSLDGDNVRHDFAGRSVRGLTADGQDSVLAIVDGHELLRRSPDGEWKRIAQSECDLACCVAVDGVIFVGTDDARMLRLEADGTLQPLTGFDAMPGRDSWYAGAAIVDGKLMGPPLGIRSMSATCDGNALLANIHVGGIARSTDSGATWQPTIHIDADVHQVLAHPSRPELVAAAAAEGLCISRDGGATWSIERNGLPGHYCSAVRFLGDDILVAASTDHFAAQGAIYRRPIDADGQLEPVDGGMPRWMEGIADTDCIAVRDSVAAVIDRSGQLYLSQDQGAIWTQANGHFPAPSGLHIC